RPPTTRRISSGLIRTFRLLPLDPLRGFRATLPQVRFSHHREITMAVTPPSHDDLAQIAERYGFRLNAQDVEEFRAVITGALASSDGVEQMYQAHQPKAPDRPYQGPADADNGLGAWYVTAEIKGADDGPLAGRRVAVKDNIEVAGLPMMNGSA